MHTAYSYMCHGWHDCISTRVVDVIFPLQQCGKWPLLMRSHFHSSLCTFHPDFDVWSSHACTNVREILGITEAFPLCCSHTVKWSSSIQGRPLMSIYCIYRVFSIDLCLPAFFLFAQVKLSVWMRALHTDTINSEDADRLKEHQSQPVD